MRSYFCWLLGHKAFIHNINFCIYSQMQNFTIQHIYEPCVHCGKLFLYARNMLPRNVLTTSNSLTIKAT